MDKIAYFTAISSLCDLLGSNIKFVLLVVFQSVVKMYELLNIVTFLIIVIYQNFTSVQSTLTDDTFVH